ncbi:hypothetical protein CDAR_495331 [Caerostris darwini]|uniref:C2H2-type domain-containing protein n=1 Tax=Caerostris darwini TaxID=1538125 RepID=A0AAV4UX40_9ARAC|nr:hypothetical protein CDAR_495331 [Caerostris darwini]
MNVGRQVYKHIDGNPCSPSWLSRLPMKCGKVKTRSQLAARVHNDVACQNVSVPSCTDLGNLRPDCVDSLIDNDVVIAMDDSCDISFPSDASLRNHLTGHKRVDLRDAAPKLSLPAPSTKKSRRRKRIVIPAISVAEPSTVTDPAAILTQPVVPSQIEPCPDDEVSGPLGHFLEPLDDFLSEQLAHDSFGAFEKLVENITHLFPDGPTSNGSSSQSTVINIDDIP